VLIIESDHRGSYAGAIRAYVEDDAPYQNSLVAVEPSSFFVLAAPDFAGFMHTWFPMAVHLLDGLFLGIRNSEATVRQRELLARLGSLSANLAHELNNPAAAAVRGGVTARPPNRRDAGRARRDRSAAGLGSVDLLAWSSPRRQRSGVPSRRGRSIGRRCRKPIVRMHSSIASTSSALRERTISPASTSLPGST
jgi:hypothetical protein